MKKFDPEEYKKQVEEGKRRHESAEKLKKENPELAAILETIYEKVRYQKDNV